MRMKTKKWSKFIFFANVRPALDVMTVLLDTIVSRNPAISNPALPAPRPAAGITAHDPQARVAWFGPQYAAGGPGVMNALGNPNTVGNGLLSILAAKDDMMNPGRWDYSAYKLTQAEIIAKWNANNNVAGNAIQLPASSIFVKGVKINALGRNTNLPTLCYLGYLKEGGIYKTREQVGKIRGYFATKKLTNPVNIGGQNYRWSMPEIDVGATVYTRIRVTVFYKIKQLVY